MKHFALALLTAITCNYQFMGMPTSSVTVSLYPDGTLEPSAEVNIGGKTHKETITPDKLEQGELIHAWLSKQNPSNAVEMIIYKQKQADGMSKLTNHNVPIGQDMWGDCTGI